jgi:aerobic-type carbon monoxide dehydrogenase small subunit (CoxS/CutS family)
MANFNFRVNNRAVSVDVDPATPLLYVLADELALNGPKFGCGLGQCGACTHPIQQAFIDEQAAQCGFCLSGVILTAKALVDRTPKPTDDQIHQALSNVLCRCFAHQRMIAAVKRYANGGAA